MQNAISKKVLDTFDYFLRICVSTNQCKELHAQAIVFGSQRSAFLASRLISVYSHLGSVKCYQRVFSSFPIEFCSNMLLWNSIVRANVSHGFYGEALKLFDKMLRLRVLPDGFTFPLMIKACSFVGSLCLSKRVHSHLVKMGFQNHLHSANELLAMYGKLGRMNIASQVFEKMPARTQISWNTMVSGYTFNHDCDGASEIFWRMGSEGFNPNSVTWTSLLSSHARCGRFEECFKLFGLMRSSGVDSVAESIAVVISVCADVAALNQGRLVHGHVIKGGFEDYLFVETAVVCMYGKCRDLENARRSFFEIKNKNLVSYNALISAYSNSGLCDEALEVFVGLEKMSDSFKPNVISWSTIISGFASQTRFVECLEIFRRMQAKRVTPNCVTLCSVLSACADSASLNLGREVHGHVIRASLDQNIMIGNVLINMYMKSGSFEQGRSVFEGMGCNKDTVSWNSMISGYGINGLGNEALNIFHKMAKPDDVTYISILSACSHSGLISEGRAIFDRIHNPTIEHYACLVDLLGRAGMIIEANEVVKTMPIEPNEYVWSALLNACRTHGGKVAEDITATAAANMAPNALLSNIYAASGKFEDSAQVRVSAKAKGIKKSAGISWVEVKKQAHMFTAGQAGPGSVYRILNELVLQMESVYDHELYSDDIL